MSQSLEPQTSEVAGPTEAFWSEVTSPLELKLTLTSHHCLIEASAGTGKSFALIFIALRLLLGANTGRPPMNLNNLLILTFTVEATQSLRRRLRQALEGLLGDCACEATRAVPSATASPWKEILEASPLTPEVQRERLQQALADLGTAPILTIHGFCARTLKHWAFRTGQMAPHFSSRQSGDGGESLWQSAAAFWTRWVESASTWERQAMLEAFPSVEAMVRALGPLMEQGALQIEGAFQTPEAFLRAYRSHRRGLKSLQTRFELHPTEDWEAGLKACFCSERGASVQAAAAIKKLKLGFSEWAIRDEVQTLLEACQRIAGWRARPEVDAQWTQCALWAQSLAWHGEHWVHSRPSLLRWAWEFAQEEGSQAHWREGSLNFRDLLTQLERGVSDPTNSALIEELLKTYPVALVDEFQDTDIKQYRILQSLTTGPGAASRCQLFLIGDPKQSIYGFRGADLATYHAASKSLRCRAYLTVNWRSSAGLLEALNALWSGTAAPFIYPEIHFRPSTYPSEKPMQSLQLRGELVAPLALYAEAQCPLGVIQYRRQMADRCAADVAYWLGALGEGEVWLTKASGERRPLQTDDMVILVKNAIEAQEVMRSLKRWGIEANYTSQEVELFKTEGGSWLFDILQAMAHHENPFALHQLFSHPQLDCFEQNFDPGEGFSRWLEVHRPTFEQASHLWSQRGLCAAVRWLLPRLPPLQKALASPTAPERMEDFFQALQALMEWESELSARAPKLWLQRLKQSLQTTASSFKTKVRPTAPNAITVSTVFKAKGMEYPWVWIPFAASPSRRKEAVQFGSLHRVGAYLPLKNADLPPETAESQSEAMRLLYVAMTRATHRLAVGIAPVSTWAARSEGPLRLPFNPFQHLLLRGAEVEKRDLENWSSALQQLQVALSRRGPEGAPLMQRLEPMTWAQSHEAQKVWKAFKKQGFQSASVREGSAAMPPSGTPPQIAPFLPWHLRSYSSLCAPTQERGGRGLPLWLRPQAENSPWDSIQWEGRSEEECSLEALATPLPPVRNPPSPKSDLSLFEVIAGFPRGPQVGDWIHHIFEAWDFRTPLESWFQNQAEAVGFQGDPNWQPWLIRWLHQVVAQPLWKQGPSLSDLPPTDCCREMNFMLHLPKSVPPKSWGQMVQSWGWLASESKMLSRLQSDPFLGGIQGFIDLVFLWKGRYYVLDYKTNALGGTLEAYSPSALDAAMAEHGYDLQLAFYQWALHRHLKATLPGYRPAQHLGGGLYLFLRGMASKPHQGRPWGVWRRPISAAQIRQLEAPWNWKPL